MATSPADAVTIPPPPPGFIPEAQANAAPTPPPGFVPENDPMRALTKADTVAPTPKPFTLPWLKDKAIRAGLVTADAMPAIGGTAGAMAGGMSGGPPGAIGGAGIVGMGGEAARQIIRRSLGYGGPSTSGEAAQDIAKQGAIQGGIQGASELLPFLAPSLKNAATTQYERALAPTTKANKAITQKIVPQLIQRGEHGSLEGLEQNAGKQAANLKPQLDAAYTATPASATARQTMFGQVTKQGSGDVILQDLENLKGKYVVQGKTANPQAVNAISGVQDVVRQYGPDINPDSLRKLKGIFDDPVAARGGYAGADLTTAYTVKAQKVAANSIRSIMGQASPDVARLNKEISFWLDVQRVTGQSAQRQTGQAGGLVKTLALPFLTGIGAAAGVHGGVEGAGAGFLTTAATLAVRSAQWRTASAILKDRFADALARGSVGDVTALLARLGVTGLEGKQLQKPSFLQGNKTQQPSSQQQ